MILRSTNMIKRKRLALVLAALGVWSGAATFAVAFFTSPRLHLNYKQTAHISVRLSALSLEEAHAAADLRNPQSPLSVVTSRKAGVPFIIIEGGVAQTRRSALRCGVNALVQQAGAQAGVNGTFFADASVQGTDNVLIGPSLCGDEARAVFNQAENTASLTGRPLVLLAAGRTRILPYNPQKMRTQKSLAARLPGLTDVFLGGVWLVHGRVAADRARIDSYHVHDAEDPRRRAFFCLLPDGRLGLGATTYVTTSVNLARALAKQGVQEAVLLDSGFSTSLVLGQKILVTGHTSPGIPSRPIPHALVLFRKTPTALTPKPIYDLESGPVLMTKRPPKRFPKGHARA